MALKDELTQQVRKIFLEVWDERDGRVVPEPKDVGLGNVGINLNATVLYADIDGSTSMVDEQTNQLAAEVYKTYLLCATKIIKSLGGVITAYDGDRVMAVYIGDYKCTNAVRSAMRIKSAVDDIINPGLKNLRRTSFVLKQVVGVDTGKLMVAQTGIRGTNDLVWVGPAANWAAKLCGISEQPFQSFISSAVYAVLPHDLKTSEGGFPMWEQRTWKGKTIYRSLWGRPL